MLSYIINRQDNPPQTCPQATNPGNSSIEILLSDGLTPYLVDSQSCLGQTPSKGLMAQCRRLGKPSAVSIIEDTVLKI